jgi:hypothetical protein
MLQFFRVGLLSASLPTKSRHLAAKLLSCLPHGAMAHRLKVVLAILADYSFLYEQPETKPV